VNVLTETLPSFLAAATIGSHSGDVGAASAMRLVETRAAAAAPRATVHRRSRREIRPSLAMKSSFEDARSIDPAPGRDYLTRR